jgi:hypothetical protein
MSVWAILGILIVVGGVLYLLFAPSSSASSDSIVLIPDVQSGQLATTRGTTSLLPSFNQPKGRVYSYTGWLVIKDFTQGYGTKRTIFSKGEAPALYLDSTSNALLVAVKTYSSVETILVPNIPAMKWIHFAIVVDQQSVDLYINGTLRQHHTLTQLPDLTEDPLTTGPGWNGYLGSLTYFRRALSYGEISSMASKPPPKLPEEAVGKNGYFDITWYIGRLSTPGA